MLTLPYALRGMGWALGLTLLSVMAAVTFYEYSLMSRVLDHCEARGRRHIRFRELAADVLGKYTPLPSTGNLPDGSIINRRHPLVHPHVLGGWVRVARDSGVNAAHPHTLGVVLALASRESRLCAVHAMGARLAGWAMGISACAGGAARPALPVLLPPCYTIKLASARW